MEESDQPSSSLTPIGGASKGTTPLEDKTVAWPYPIQPSETSLEVLGAANVSGSAALLPHFHMC